MEKKHVTEVVVYTVKKADDLKPMQTILDEIINGFDGYISRSTLKHIQEPLTYLDIVHWKSAESAKKAEKAFHSHPRFEEISKLFGETKFFSQFKPL